VSQSGSQAAAFFREVAVHRTVWFVRDDRGSPTFPVSGERRALPYWSSPARAHRAADIWAAGLRTASLPVEGWRDAALPSLAADGYQIGINWTGPSLTGWDLTVAEVLNRLAHTLGEGP
jgi:hypothetical protein